MYPCASKASRIYTVPGQPGLDSETQSLTPTTVTYIEKQVSPINLERPLPNKTIADMQHLADPFL